MQVHTWDGLLSLFNSAFEINLWEYLLSLVLVLDMRQFVACLKSSNWEIKTQNGVLFCGPAWGFLIDGLVLAKEGSTQGQPGGGRRRGQVAGAGALGQAGRKRDLSWGDID